MVTCPIGDLARGATRDDQPRHPRAADPFPTDSLVNGEVVNVAIVSGINNNCGPGSTDPVCRDDWPMRPTASAAPSESSSLPFTGAVILWLIVAAAGAITAGVLLLCVPWIPAAGRRKRFAE